MSLNKYGSVIYRRGLCHSCCEAVDWRSCLLIYHPVAQNQNAFKWTIRCFTKPKYSENCAILKPLRSPQWGPHIWRKTWSIWEGVLSDLSGQSRHFFGAVKLWTHIWETIKIPIYFDPLNGYGEMKCGPILWNWLCLRAHIHSSPFFSSGHESSMI